jgi:hypothetical protein
MVIIDHHEDEEESQPMNLDLFSGKIENDSIETKACGSPSRLFPFFKKNKIIKRII